MNHFKPLWAQESAFFADIHKQGIPVVCLFKGGKHARLYYKLSLFTRHDSLRTGDITLKRLDRNAFEKKRVEAVFGIKTAKVMMEVKRFVYGTIPEHPPA